MTLSQTRLLNILLNDPEKVKQLQDSSDEHTAKKMQKDTKNDKSKLQKQKDAEEWLQRHDFTEDQIKAIQDMLPSTLAFDIQLFKHVRIRKFRLALLGSQPV